jgi:curved DNA-binding protein CbpA
MSKKKNKKQRYSEVKQEIPVHDDPYWEVSGIYLDPQRISRHISKFERFEDKYPFWVDELMEGIPTFYCVLGVAKGTEKNEIEKAFEKKMKLSCYPDNVIEEAFEVLSSPDLKKKYDELLSLFRQITKCMPPEEKNELINNHNNYIHAEKDFIRMEVLTATYGGYFSLYPYGIPDLYEIIGLDKTSPFNKIKRKCKTGSELFKKIYTILGDPVSRADYDFMMHFTIQYGDKKIIKKRNSRQKMWDNLDNDLFEKIVFTALTESINAEESVKRFTEILNRNPDWKQYLPSNNKTFFSILGLDSNSLSGDKKEIEKIMREKYRPLEKTPEVNLAYSMLKNASLRDDYIWLIEKSEILSIFSDIIFQENDFSSETIQSDEMKESFQSDKVYTQTTIGNIIEMINKNN